MSDSSVLILGARGSVPVSAPCFASYGGATTCVLVHLADRYFVLDAGTGVLRLPAAALAQDRLTLLLSHVHLDHLNGFSMCPYVSHRDKTLDIYASPADGSEIGDVLRSLYKPPVWPVLPDQLAATLIYHPLPDTLSIGNVTITTLDGVHPGGVKLIRLDSAGKRVVFATDCTLTQAFYPKAVAFAKGCDVLLCDGQYSEEEWEKRSAFGHNTWLTAARLGTDCGAKQVRIIHHDPTHTDAILDAAAAQVRAINAHCLLAHEGEEIFF